MGFSFVFYNLLQVFTQSSLHKNQHFNELHIVLMVLEKLKKIKNISLDAFILDMTTLSKH